MRNYDKKKDTTGVQEADVLGFENLVFPFLTLFIGIVFAFAQLAIELMLFYKKSCNNKTNFPHNEHNSKEIIEEVSKLLKKYARKPKNENLLAQIRTLVMCQNIENKKMY